MAPLSLDHAKNYRNERILDDTRDVTDGRIDREVLTIYTPDNVVTHTRVVCDKHLMRPRVITSSCLWPNSRAAILVM